MAENDLLRIARERHAAHHEPPAPVTKEQIAKWLDIRIMKILTGIQKNPNALQPAEIDEYRYRCGECLMIISSLKDRTLEQVEDAMTYLNELKPRGLF